MGRPRRWATTPGLGLGAPRRRRARRRAPRRGHPRAAGSADAGDEGRVSARVGARLRVCGCRCTPGTSGKPAEESERAFSAPAWGGRAGSLRWELQCSSGRVAGTPEPGSADPWRSLLSSPLLAPWIHLHKVYGFE